MPISLPPLSRRRFLRRSLAAAGGAALGAELLGEAREPDGRSWALLSDTHLAANRDLVSRGVNMTDHFKSVSEEVVGAQTAWAGLMITGDCAYNSGELVDYAHLGDLLRPIRRAGLPVHLALGNHDHRERFWQAFVEEKKAARPLADRQVALLRTDQVNWFILDSLETTLSSPGLLGPEQLQWLARALDENSTTPALVVVHHNPGLNGGNLGLKDTFPFLEVIRPRHQVKAYIYGHTHNWKVETDTSGIHLINLPPVSYVFREGEPSGWVRVQLLDDGMQLELRCIDRTHKDHGQKLQLQWRV
ncbi:MAG TPA: metallophosphoesterase [Verrucomicrobiae bacterium]|nr:metallophosphoesterase [Verrucomicrobiae bacterium]